MGNIPHNDLSVVYEIIIEKSRGQYSMISFRPFRELMEARKISTYYLRNKCGDYNIDHKTIERLMADESVSTNTLNSLCHIFKCDFSEIMEFVLDGDNEIME
jgi:DNA-binding Xre family transcriptional regulator